MLLLVCNEKGGVGKTTVATNLAAMAAMAGHETLLVDADGDHGSASAWATVREEQPFAASITTIQRTGRIAADLIRLREKYAVVIVDAGGADSVELRQAMLVADFVLMPVEASQFDLWRFAHTASLLDQARAASNRDIPAACVLNNAPTHARSREAEEAREALEEFAPEIALCQTTIHSRAVFRKASRAGQAVVELEGRAADPAANAEMSDLFSEMFGYAFATAESRHVA